MHYIDVYKTVRLTQNLSEIQSVNSELELAQGIPSHVMRERLQSRCFVNVCFTHHMYGHILIFNRLVFVRFCLEVYAMNLNSLQLILFGD